jgi:hypothetical protein
MHFPCFILLVAQLAARSPMLAEEPTMLPREDCSVVPGKRVGLVMQYSSLSTLQAIYGMKNVRSCQLDTGGGTLSPGAKIFEGTDRALDILWAQDGVEKRIAEVRILGRGWKFQNGLQLGMSLAEVEKINGHTFKVSGFGWDYGGYATFEVGKLSGGMTVRFKPTEAQYAPEAHGDVSLSSDSTALLSAQPVIEAITVSFCSPETVH